MNKSAKEIGYLTSSVWIWTFTNELHGNSDPSEQIQLRTVLKEGTNTNVKEQLLNFFFLENYTLSYHQNIRQLPCNFANLVNKVPCFI